MFPVVIYLAFVFVVCTTGASIENSDVIANFEMKQQNGGLCLAEHNNYRSQNGKTSLAWDSKLANAARRHNQEMVSKKCFSHQCNGEPPLGQRVSQAGYNWRSVGENIAGGQSNCKTVMEAWMNSSGHRANILGNFVHVGCANQQCQDCQYKIYWTCVFGSPQ